MITQNKAYYLTDCFSRSFCDEIIDFAKPQDKVTALTGEIGEEQKKVRNSKVIWLEEPWIAREIMDACRVVNERAEWNFVLNTLEKMQFTIYDSSGQHYEWHTDSNFEGKFSFRKLSFSLQLSEPWDYGGGQLLIDNDLNKSYKNKSLKHTEFSFQTTWLSKGTIIFFPSYQWHKVTPVFRGTRYSLVGWFNGPRFV